MGKKINFCVIPCPQCYAWCCRRVREVCVGLRPMRNIGKIVSLVFIAALFFAGQAMAASTVTVNLDKAGTGSGRVVLSARASFDWSFSGWTGESCLGVGSCILNDLISNRSKMVVAHFNAPICTDFVYSDWGSCQFGGKMYRDVVLASPPGCIGGDPVTSWGCNFSGEPCVWSRTTQSTIIDWSWTQSTDIYGPPAEEKKDLTNSVKDGWNSLWNGDWSGAMDNVKNAAIAVKDGIVQAGTDVVNTLTGNVPTVPSVTSGGGPNTGGNYAVDISDRTAGTPVSSDFSNVQKELDISNLDILEPIEVTAPREEIDLSDFELDEIVVTSPWETDSEVSVDLFDEVSVGSGFVPYEFEMNDFTGPWKCF